MKIIKFHSAFIVVLFLLSAIPSVLGTLPTAVSVVTDQPYYHSGDVVKISGLATKPGAVTIVFKVGGAIISTVTATAATVDGSYQYNYNLPANPEKGIWTVEVKDSTTPTPKSAETTFTVLNAATMEIAEKLYEMAKNAKTFAEAKLGLQPPKAAQENFNAGVKALDDAKSFMENGKYVASIESSLRAQKHFGNTLKIMALGHLGTEVSESTKLGNQIERAQKMIDNLWKVYENIKDKLVEAKSNIISGELAAAQTDLNSAKTQLPTDENLAKASLTKATDHLSTVKGLIQDYADTRKKEQILNFIDKAEERILKLEESIGKLRERIGDANADALIVKLNLIKTQLEALRGLVVSDATVAVLNGKMKEIQDILGGIHDFSLREGLKELHSMHAWVQIMKETRVDMMKKGLKIDDLDTHIKQGEDEIGNNISELAAGRKMISKFSDIIKEFKGNNQKRGD